MSGHSANRRKTSATASAGVPPLNDLPAELLETIFGFLDVRTLCTARLVCAQFRGAASRCIHSVELSVETLRSRPETTLDSFPNLSRATVFDVKEGDLSMLAGSPVGGEVTHLRAVESLRLAPLMQRRGLIAAGPPRLVQRRGRIVAGGRLTPLSALVSLTVRHADRWAFAFPKTLRELTLEGSATLRTTNFAARLTNLTCLQIDVSCRLRKPFEAVTALTALERLEIACGLSLIPTVAELTQLTHLHFRGAWQWLPAGSSASAVGSLTRLHRLVHLGAERHGLRGGQVESQLLASIGTLTGLQSLDVGLHGWPEASAFETRQLTALRLHVCPGTGAQASFLPGLDLEGLRDLSLTYGPGLHRDGVAALSQATGLTRLELCNMGSSVIEQELGAALACMPRLRALTLGTAADIFPVWCISRLPAGLTQLKLTGCFVTNKDDMRVLLGLKKLRVLSMWVYRDPRRFHADPVTADEVFAVAKLPELTKLALNAHFGMLGGDSAHVWAWLNAERHDKGWPPLELNLLR